MLVMLLALVFRGGAFEFRFHHPGLRRFGDRAFCLGSGVATFAQGVEHVHPGLHGGWSALRRNLIRLDNPVRIADWGRTYVWLLFAWRAWFILKTEEHYRTGR